MMKHIVLASMLALALLVPTLSPLPRVANAVGIGIGAGGVTTRYYPTCALYGGDDVCLSIPTVECPMTDVGASVTRDGSTIRGHVFNYRLVEPCKDVQVHGSYSPLTGDLSETLEGSDWKIKALWNCKADPWALTSRNDWPDCSRTSVSGSGNVVSGLYPIEGVNYPVSVVPLSDLSLQTLNGQLQNAIKQAEKPTAPRVVPTTAPSAPPLLTLKAGSTGPGVEALQYLLRFYNFDLEVDGDFGDQTAGAVRSMQNNNGLPATGIVNEKTWRVLWVALKRGDQNDAVSAVQTLLNRHKIDVAVDGDFGEQTEAAVKAFQQKKGLIVGGVVEGRTWEALCVAVASLGTRSSE